MRRDERWKQEEYCVGFEVLNTVVMKGYIAV
jgi:hypothetical protein